MATLNQNGINFTLDADSVGVGLNGKYTHQENYDDSTGLYNVDDIESFNRVSMSFNAVEIDWNDAELGEVNGIPLGTIKTTGDLIKVIQG